MSDRSIPRRGMLALGATALVAGCTGLFGPEFPEDSERPPEEYVDVVRTFVQRVHAGEYEAAREPFTQDLADALPAAEIESVWDEETGHLGSYEEISAWAYEPDEADDEAFEIVYARVGMAEGRYDLRVTMDQQSRMAGVFIIDVQDE